MTRPLTLACALALLLAPACRAQADPAAIASRLEPIRARHGLPALGGAIVRADGTSVVGVTGVRAEGSTAPVTTADPWHLGSCTKAMTATLVAVQVEKGALAWTTTLGAVFPELAEGMDPAWREVTVEQLLSHRAGAPAELDQDGLWGWLWKDEGARREQRLRVVQVVTRRRPVHAPGSGFLYSNAGYMIAGAILEKIADRPWEELLRTDLLEPLGVAGAGLGAPGSLDLARAPDAPRGHLLRGGLLVPVPSLAADGPARSAPADNPPALGPAGTVHAPLEGWGRFVALHLRGAQEGGLGLTPGTFAALHTPRGDGYALGWGTGERGWAGAGGAPGPILTHSGSNTMWYCVAWLAPARGLAVLVTTNAGHPPAPRACDEAAGALLQLAGPR